MGNADFGELTFESAAYCARYICKKVNGKLAKAHYQGKQPEFSLQSQSLGKPWYEKHKDHIFPRDEIIVRGKPSRPPRSYVEHLRKESEYDHALLAHQRNDSTPAPRVDLPWRLQAAEKITQAKSNLIKRDL